METELTMNTIESNLHHLVVMFRKLTNYRNGKIKLKASFVNEVEAKAREVLGMAASRTMEHGHSARLDRVKNRAFEMLGKTLGDDL